MKKFNKATAMALSAAMVASMAGGIVAQAAEGDAAGTGKVYYLNFKVDSYVPDAAVTIST